MLVSRQALTERPVSFLGKLALLLGPAHILASSLLPQHHGPVADGQSEP